MSTLKLRASLALWRRRLTYRQKRVDYHRGKAKSGAGNATKGVVTAEEAALIKHWERLRNEAKTLIAHRETQLREQRPMRERALDEAESLVGVMEAGGNNMGAKVLEIIRANGGAGPEPWCGDFVAWCYRKAGSKAVQRGWAAVRLLGFLTGMRIVSAADARPGDIVCFSFDHTGLLRRKTRAVQIETVEGTTGRSGAVSDSRTGGDGVYLKRRSTSQVTRYVRVTR
jgi:hypothetical protein